MVSIPELLDGHVTLEVECLDRLYLNGYTDGLATPGGLVTFIRVQLGRPIPSPVVPGQRKRGVRDEIVFVGVAQEKAKAFNGTKVNGQFLFNRDKSGYVNHHHFCIDDATSGRCLFLRLGAGKEPMVERLVNDPALLQLPFSDSRSAIHWGQKISTGYSGSG